MRALDSRRVPYEAHRYDPSFKSAPEVAAALGVPPGNVYKTLVMTREGGRPFLLMAPGDREVDPRRLAGELDVKAVRMAPKSEAERLTGLQTGGIGALALLDRNFDIFLDDSALNHDCIFVNGGRRGLNLKVRVGDVIEVTGARIVRAME